MKFELPDIPVEQQSPIVKSLLVLVEQLIEHTQKQEEEIGILKDDIKILKGEKKRPKFKASKLDEKTDADGCETKSSSKKLPKAPRKNKKNLTIHRTEKVKVESVPQGSRFKGYKDFVIQELVIKNENVRYRLERWLSPDGKLISASLPASLENRHYGPQLITYLLYQHHHCLVTQPLLLEQLQEWGIEISSGQINRLLSEDKERFHQEKDELLKVGLNESQHVTVDDSGARHQGKNGYVTHIGNDDFAWFASTSRKNRVNFLELLHAGDVCYRLTPAAFDYMSQHKLPKEQQLLLESTSETHFNSEQQWAQQLEQLNIVSDRHIRTATEGALMGSLLLKTNIDELAIISDGAGQFNVLRHGLCWVHAERLIHTMQALNDQHRLDLEKIRSEIWALYSELKAYKKSPNEALIATLSAQFDEIFTQKTSYVTLNRLLARLHKQKEKLLLVLKYPYVPLHTNGSEGDIRTFVKKRKVSGGTRSDLGQQCRDTFTSIKKTCRKLSVSFWQYLLDRHQEQQTIPQLSELVRLRINKGLATGL